MESNQYKSSIGSIRPDELHFDELDNYGEVKDLSNLVKNVKAKHQNKNKSPTTPKWWLREVPIGKSFDSPVARSFLRVRKIRGLLGPYLDHEIHISAEFSDL